MILPDLSYSSKSCNVQFGAFSPSNSSIMLLLAILVCLFWEGLTVCDQFSKPLGSKCVQVHHVGKRWEDAKSVCESAGGSLLELNDGSLQSVNSLNGLNQIWVGARKQKSWYWTSDGTMDNKLLIKKTFWAPKEPNQNAGNKEDRISLYKSHNYMWNDEASTKTESFALWSPTLYKAMCQCHESVNIADGKVILVLDDIKYFTPHKKGITWDEAVKACQQTQGANLVNINTQRVQDVLKNELLILSENYHYWTAGYWNGKLTFSWNKGGNVDTAPVGAQSFGPDDDVCLYTDGLQLHASLCNKAKNFICERPHRAATTTATTPTTTTTTTVAQTTAAATSISITDLSTDGGSTLGTDTDDMESEPMSSSGQYSSWRCSGRGFDFDGRCIFSPNKTTDWVQADKTCRLHKAHLVSLKTEGQLQAFYNHTNGQGQFWVSLKKKIPWFWSRGAFAAGSPITEFLWEPGSEPTDPLDNKDGIILRRNSTDSFYHWDVEDRSTQLNTTDLVCQCQSRGPCKRRVPSKNSPYMKIGEDVFFIATQGPVANWYDELLSCQSKGGMFPIIINRETLEGLSAFLINRSLTEAVWTSGYKNKRNEYLWWDGTPVSNVSKLWAPFEPTGFIDRICAHVERESTTYRLKTAECDGSTSFPFYCEIDMLPTTTTTTPVTTTSTPSPTSTTAAATTTSGVIMRATTLMILTTKEPTTTTGGPATPVKPTLTEIITPAHKIPRTTIEATTTLETVAIQQSTEPTHTTTNQMNTNTADTTTKLVTTAAQGTGKAHITTTLESTTESANMTKLFTSSSSDFTTDQTEKNTQKTINGKMAAKMITTNNQTHSTKTDKATRSRIGWDTTATTARPNGASADQIIDTESTRSPLPNTDKPFLHKPEGIATVSIAGLGALAGLIFLLIALYRKLQKRSNGAVGPNPMDPIPS